MLPLRALEAGGVGDVRGGFHEVGWLRDSSILRDRKKGFTLEMDPLSQRYVCSSSTESIMLTQYQHFLVWNLTWTMYTTTSHRDCKFNITCKTIETS